MSIAEAEPRPAISFRPLEGDDAAAVRAWRYPPPYDVYDEVDGGDDEGADDRGGGFTARYALVEEGELVGFCSFGVDARVPGGIYPAGWLDVGLGLRPDMIGRGLGARYLAAALAFARRALGATAFRVTVAEFNARAQRLCERAGFRPIARFQGPDRPFCIFVRGPDGAAPG